MRLILLTLLLGLAAPCEASPLSNGSFAGTLRFVRSNPPGCPPNACPSQLATDFVLTKSGKRWRFRRASLNGVLSKGRNGFYSGYVGTVPASPCVIDVVPALKNSPNKGFIAANYVLVVRCPQGSLTALYSGRARKR